MRTETSGRTTTSVPKPPPSLPQARESDHFRYLPPCDSDPPASSDTMHDAMLLVAALEDLEARRVALEWLLENNLLCACLV